MSTQDMYEKEEKDRAMEEKSEEKVYEKEAEKRWEEKWSRDPLSAIVWAIILIWAGLVLLAANLNLLDRFGRLGDLGSWSIVLGGVGLILLAEVLIRLLIPQFSGPVVGTLILGFILIGVSLGSLITWDLIWPTILIVLGIVVLLGNILRRR
jgi:hypothetical protein